MESNTIQSAFSKWKIGLALLLGLSVSFFILFRSLSKEEYKAVKAGTGTHIWVDVNKNGLVDFSNPKEFSPATQGSFKQQTAWEVIADIEWSAYTYFWLFMAIVGMFGRDLAYMWRIRILTKKELSWKRSFHVIMLWEFASALAPGVVSGATVAMFILHREKIAMGRSTAIVIITAFFDNLFYVIMVPVVFLFVDAHKLFPQHVETSGIATAFWTGYSIFAVLCLILYLSIFRFPHLIKHILSACCRLPYLNRWQQKANQTGNDIALTASIMKKEKSVFWAQTFLATCISWTSRYLVINFILQAFLHLGWIQQTQVLAKQFVLWMFLRISPTPGGSGVAEWAFGELLGTFTTSLVLLAGMAVLWRLISYFPYLIIGSILLPRWLKSTKSI